MNGAALDAVGPAAATVNPDNGNAGGATTIGEITAAAALKPAMATTRVSKDIPMRSLPSVRSPRSSEKQADRRSDLCYIILKFRAALSNEAANERAQNTASQRDRQLGVALMKSMSGSTALSAAIGLAIALQGASAAAAAMQQDDPAMQQMMKFIRNKMQKEHLERCWGINAAGKNDCGSAAHACHGQATVARDPGSYVLVPVGVCDKIAGGIVKSE